MSTFEHTQQTVIYHPLSHAVDHPCHTTTYLIEQGYRLKEIMEKFPTIQSMESLGYKHAYQNSLLSVLHLYLEKRLKKEFG